MVIIGAHVQASATDEPVLLLPPHLLLPMYCIKNAAPDSAPDEAAAPAAKADSLGAGGSQLRPLGLVFAAAAQAEAMAKDGWTHQQAGRKEEALNTYQRALGMLERSDPRRHWRLLVPVKNNMAMILRGEGRLEEAERCYIQAANLMRACDTTSGSEELAGLMGNLATLYLAAAMPEAAVRMQERLVAALEKCSSTPREVLGRACMRLAKLCRHAGDPAMEHAASERAGALMAGCVS